MEKYPLVSIIIPTYNSSRTLENTLISIVNQTYKNIEIIVIDNNSKDNTKEIAFKYTKNVFNKWPERTAQKNYWIEKSNWEYLLLIDWDMSLDNNLIEDCILKLELSEKNAGVCIPVVDIWNSFWTKVIAFERSFYKWTDIEAARFLKTSLVNKVWWYKDIIFYEEFIVPQEISKLWFNVKIHTEFNIYHDYDDFSFKLNLKKKFYYWKSLNKYKEEMQILWLDSFSNNQTWIISRYMIFLKNKRFYKNPILAISVLILKTLEFWSGALGLIFSKLKNNLKYESRK